MQLQQLLQKKYLIPLAAVLLVATAGALFYNFFVFHITYLSPRTGTIPTSQTTITVETNHMLKSADVVTTTDYDQRIEGKTLLIDLPGPLNEGDKVSFDITLTSTNNTTLRHTMSLTAAFVPSSMIEEREYKKHVEQSNSFETTCAVQDKLPYTTPDYELSSEFPDNGETKLKIIFLDKNVISPNTPTEAELQQFRSDFTDAKQWLDSNGYDADQCQLYFWQPYLLDEFQAIYYDPNNITGD